MNLIEQLGGYEEAKAESDRISNILNNGEFLGGGSPRESLYERLDALESALLEYRRQHNIFEVGDKVVFKNVEKFKDNMLQVAHIELQKVLDIKSGLNGYTSFDELRHAAPEELEAGKRLEVK